MPVRTFTPGNVIMGQANVYVAPVGTPLVPDSVPLDGDWTAAQTASYPGTPTQNSGNTGTLAIAAKAWAPVGASAEGWTENRTVNSNPLYIEEQVNPVVVGTTTGTYAITGTFAEETVQSLAIALNATTTVNTAGAAGSGKPASTDLRLNDVLIAYALGLEGLNAQGFPIRLYIPVVNNTSTVAAAFRRATAYRQYAVQFSSVSKSSDILTHFITSANP